ncbi:ribosome biogenesis GTPase YlqF [Cohnella sp. CIP 111063]|uniref:ribosome biogenesis GTPase YlqF n=1 Tax=unclassified Cohnella TaxID=2636738 RepID=UPI000B8C02BD|nr:MULTISPECIES: ribosome biogenesis GTPase YlqF [unclassified Cohnella]OXS52608.1 ribosome biogenesis GTPase YlqF [Cohnella sp. CIP 111063]PRX58870.1 Ras superfamily GTP-binding protein YlqF [Cohnella sp. SGD-V74]
MTIQWFPGHMTRARRQIEEKLKLIDVVFELLDARIPSSSRNPMVDEITGAKPRLVLLNKADLADPERTAEWSRHFREQGLAVHAIDANAGAGVKDLAGKAKELLKEKIDRQIAKGMKPRPIRALIVGIPNVGKSTLINRLAGRNIAVTGDRPGVTKGQQWIRFGGELELLDTPGILWPKFEDPIVGFRLAATGAIKEDVIHIDEVACFVLKVLVEEYGSVLGDRYGLTDLPEELPDMQAAVEVLESIGRRRGCIVSGGNVDYEKAATVLLRDLRSGKLGKMTLEMPGEAQ